MSEVAVESARDSRAAEEKRPFDPLRISPTRVNSYLSCGHAFKRKYIDRDPPQLSGSAALFGNVIHGALEKWSLNRQQDLVSLVAQSWVEVTKETAVADFLKKYQGMSPALLRAEAAAKEAWEKKNPGKESKAPRMTKLFKDTPEARALSRLLAEWIPVLNEQSPWRFTERDPLPNLYDESLVLAKKYSRTWRHLPPSLYTEFGFTVPYRDYILRGYIDAIDPVLDEGEIVGYEVTDYKTYRAEPAPAKDHRQAVIYDVAFEWLCREGHLPFDPELPRWVVFDYVRLFKRKDFVLGEADRAVLSSDLDMYHAGVTAGVFLPAQKNQNPDFCDYEDCCLKTRGAGCNSRGSRYPDEEEA